MPYLRKKTDAGIYQYCVEKGKIDFMSSVIEHKELTESADMIITPFLKWAGGKRWLIKKHPEYFRHDIIGRYFEPFLGGGAVFSEILPQKAVLSDINGDLINLYEQIKIKPVEVSNRLEIMHKNHSTDYYYMMRDLEVSDPFERALRFLYLNRACFNGIYRVNKNGKFNVPKGSKDKIILPTDDFNSWSNVLQAVELVVSDFRDIIQKTKQGDLIFADPPYTVSHNTNGFLKYNEILFSWKDQITLAEELAKASERGVSVIATNANHKDVVSLYEKEFTVEVVSRSSLIAASSNKRKRYDEVVIHNLNYL